MYLPYYFIYNALELQVGMKFGVVTEVSTFLVITQVSKKNCIFSSLANIMYLHVKIASYFSQYVKSCVLVSNSLMFGPVQSQWTTSQA